MADTLQTIKALYAAFAEGDVPAILGIFDAQIQWLEAESGPLAEANPYLGPMAVAEGIFMRLAGDIDNFTVSVEQLSGDSKTVTAQGRYRGMVNATGTELDAQFAHIWTVHEGKITGFQQYTDTHQWRTAYGS